MNPVPAASAAPSAVRRSHRRLSLAAALVATTTALAAASMTAHAAVPPPPSGWSLVWSDDFTGAAGTLPSSANWIIDTGTSYPGGPANWGTGEIQTYTSSTANLSQDGAGNLRITPLRDGSGRWTSARIETARTDFKPPAGGVLAMEGRIQMPNVVGAEAAGYWPAFWALGSPYRGNYQNWPGVGEFDVMENVNGINSVWGVLHCGVAPGGPCNEFNGIGNSRACPGSTCQSAFHTYRFEWDASVSPQQLRWYVDGQLFHTVSQSQVGTYWGQMTNHGGYFLLLNVAMGGGFPNGVAGTTTPTSATVSGRPMLVDYVAVYTRGGGNPPPTTPPPTTPPPGGTVDAYSTIQAEAFNAQNGVQVEACAEGGQNIGWLSNGDWARYDNVDFGGTPPGDFVARVASGAAAGVSGLVEVRVDSVSNPPIGSFAIANTGGWQSWRSVPGNVGAVTGRHTVYLTFTSGQPADFVNVNWFTFRR
ncbi:carbohydrate-binding protein [Micromonospora sp. SL1-18]|uniref:carbohydrate-binding protein n=1 Tax=Micromonospora sp. SL1-18 TaxID=3399128 RepID=UPI003A4D9E54